MALIPQSNDETLKLTGTERGTNDALAQGTDDVPLIGDRYTLEDSAVGGNDRLTGSQVFGDAVVMSGASRGGNDRLDGGAGDDGLVGDAGFMDGTSRGGNDRLDGGDGDDGLRGDAVQMSGAARGGNDALSGGGGDDVLYGDALQAFTAGATDAIAAGDDVLRGGTGDDDLWGDFALVTGAVTFGRDTFVFEADSGQDEVLDFQQGLDKFDVSALGITGLDGLTITGAGGNVVDFGGGNAVTVTTLVGAAVALLAADFVFA